MSISLAMSLQLPRSYLSNVILTGALPLCHSEPERSGVPNASAAQQHYNERKRIRPESRSSDDHDFTVKNEILRII